MTPIYGRDFAAVYNEKWSFWGPKRWPFLWKTVKRHNPRASTWLDLCCGAGSLLPLICRQGFETVGLDQSRWQLEHARRNAPRARLVRSDLRRFSLRQKFEVISCMYDSLNYLIEKRDLAQVFLKIKAHLSESGIFIFDLNTFWGLKERWSGNFVNQDASSVVILQSEFHEPVALGCCRITGFVKEGRRFRKFKEEHLQRGYRAREVEALLKKAGFAFRKRDGDSLGQSHPRSGRLLYVCKKKRLGELLR